MALKAIWQGPAMPILLTLATLTAISMGMLLFTETGRGFLEQHGQGVVSEALRTRELALKQELGRTLGWNATEEELDLANPSEKDVRFLLETFGNGEEKARPSAARALVVLQEPRAVLPLLVKAGTPEERSFYCSAALEILRFRDRPTTVSLLVQALELETARLEPACREELRSKLVWLQPFDADVLQALITHNAPALQQFALKNMLTEPPEELVQSIADLTQSRTQEVAKAAKQWMETRGLEVISVEPAATALTPQPGLPSPHQVISAEVDATPGTSGSSP